MHRHGDVTRILSIVIESIFHYLNLNFAFLINIITKLNMVPVLCIHSIHKTQI